jgi:putative transposase
MGTISRPRIVSRSTDLEADDLPDQVTIAVRELAGTVKEGLLALSVGVGLAVVHELFEAEVSRLAGPKGKHDPERRAYRHGQESRQVTLGGRRVQVDKPRVRSVDEHELELRTFRAFAGRDLLNTAALQRMLVGLSTRHYPAGLEPVGDIEQLATSKSAVSRRFVQGTEHKLAEVFGRDLSQLDLVAIFIDGMLIAEQCVVVALGVDADGRKQPLGLWEGSTENKTVCTALLNNLIERGLDPEQVRLFVLDGGKAIRAAVQSTFGKHAVIQRCRAHKRRNVLDHLPQSERTFIGRKLDQAWKEPNADRAEAQLRALAKHLEVKHPGAAASLLEGLVETLTVTRLGLSPSLLRTFKSTNPVGIHDLYQPHRSWQRQTLA